MSVSEDLMKGEVVWFSIDPALRIQSAKSAGYRVLAAGPAGSIAHGVRGWGFLTPGGHEKWGMADESAAWDEAFRHMCSAHQPVVLHKKGGIYRVLGEAHKAWTEWDEDATQKVMTYEHLAPHERAMWVRDLSEFHDEGRFRKVLP